MKRFMVIWGMVVACLGFVAVGSAVATPTLTISDGVAADTVTASSASGVVTFSGTVGDYTLNITTGLTMPAIGSASNPVMDILSFNATLLAPTSEVLTIAFSATDFTASPVGLALQIGGTSIGGSATVVDSAYFDKTDKLFGTGSLIGSTGALAGSPFGGSAVGAVTSPSPYSLTDIITLTPGTGGSQPIVSFDASLSATPEPASLFLVGSGLAGWGFLRRFRKKA